jgi:hypothetical protein
MITPELSARIQRRIDELQPSDALGDWPTRHCKQKYNALPLHSTVALYLWALRPDGTLLCFDLDTLLNPIEPETDPITIYAVLLHGSRYYPELQELVPPLPEGGQPCPKCEATGRIQSEPESYKECSRCNGLGWFVVRQPG